MEKLQGCDATVLEAEEAIIIQTPTAGGLATCVYRKPPETAANIPQVRPYVFVFFR